MFPNRKMIALLGAMALCAVEGYRAQTPETPPESPAAAGAKPDLATLQAEAKAAEEKMPTPEVKLQQYFDLTAGQRERWQKFLPQTLMKLTRREQVQIVVLGDAILDSVAADDGSDPLLKSFAGVFAKAMASQFFYTGGVRVLRPESELRAKESMMLGPEILLQPVRTSSIVSAASALATVGFQGRPDLVLVAHGLEDGAAGTSAADIATALLSLRDTVRENGLEWIVAAPIPQASEPEEASLAMSRSVTSVMKEFCAGENVLFSDLGDLSRLITMPSGPQEAHLLFPMFVQQLRSRLEPVAADGLALPTRATHEALGRILFEDVMQGAPRVAWRVSDAKATLEGSGVLKLEFQLANSLKEPLEMTVLPLVPRGFRPKDTNARIKLAAEGRETVTIEYAITDTRYLPLVDGEARLPVLVIAGKASRIHDLAADLQPFNVAWNERTAFNLEAEYLPEIEIANGTAKKLSASWEAEWAGKKQQGKFDIGVEASETPGLRLALPTGEEPPFRQRLPLKLEVSGNGVRQIFDRHVEITRNFGLRQTVPLAAEDGQPSAVTLRADADGMKLFLTLDLTGVNLADRGDGEAFELLLNLDARSYGQRLTPGATAALRITGRAADGEATVHEVAPWAFGSGYAAVFDVKEIGARLSSSANGRRRLTLTLPKGYLYLHEWALGNGNSQFGINVRFSGGGREFFLTRGSRQGDDAESLSVLELTDKPTRRWTARLE
ncbi:MAG: hypothetical protein R3F13_13060 [Prosthecobacter sp.]